ncbi:pyrophosphatase PpaX [Thermoactinomyces mirandus]|uniref:Pyrophosphatase PpaX n=1 Tax=Thermoactinomyces mirandus TaxID=2756294 RepID=A0A7W2ASE4_9BACL|nr:pyrophosphatase PpaX [Thermoactinomyces mirandus]MBA4603533.1 pyrophosphatase PpaX [Thermoactinomyces mirandus]
MRYSVILFDLDGTLINTNSLILASFMHTLESHCPGKYTVNDVIPIMGEPLLDQMRHFDPSQAEEMVKTYQTYNVRHHDDYVEEFPHVRQVLQQLHQAGIALGIVSNKRRLVVEKGLDLFGLKPLMQTIVCIGDTEKAKPEPDMIRLALKQVNATPDQALMVGDSRYDLIAANRASVNTAAVTWSLHLEELRRYNPDYILEDMRDLLGIMQISGETCYQDA